MILSRKVRKDRGKIYKGTLRQSKRVAALLRRGLTHKAIGDELGLHQTSVSRIVRQFNLASTRRKMGPKPDWYYRPRPIDPAKAARITDEKRRYWGAA